MNSFLATLYLLVGCLVVLLGLVILREGPGEKANRATSLMLFSGGVGSVLGGFGLLLLGAGATRDGPNDLLRSFNYLWEFFFPSLLYFASVFPEENRLTRRIPFLAAWIFAPHLFHLAFLALAAQGAFWGQVAAWMAQSHAGAAFLKAIRIPLELVLQTHRLLFSVVNLLYIAAALTLLWFSFRRTHNALIREQVGVIFAGLASCAGLYAVAIPIPTLLNTGWPPLTRSALVVAALVLGSGSIAWSMVRHRFLDANLIARKSILYAVTSAFLIGVYLGVVRRVDALLETQAGFDTTALQTAILLLALVLFQPASTWLEETLERFFLRQQSDHRTLLRRVTGEALIALDPEELADNVVNRLREGVMARTTILLLAPPGGRRVVRGFGVGVDLDAVAALPREALRRLLGAAAYLRREEVRALTVERGLTDAAAPLLAADPFLVFPVRHGAEFLGLIALGRKITETRYTAEEVSLLQTVANQCGVGAKNAILYQENLAKTVLEEELAVARRIQQQSLPTHLPQTPHVHVAAMGVPSKYVGGDYYDCMQLEGEHYLIAIADVAGKGVPAALLASMVQACIRTQAQDGKPVHEVLARLNRLVHEATPEDRFATCFLGLLGSEGLQLSFSNAGHNYPILASNGSTRFLEEGGIPLGIDPEARYPDVRVSLGPGDTLVLYTDGITDARGPDGTDYGEERLIRLVRELPRALTAEETLRAIVADVQRFTAGTEQMDDMTLLALKVV
ncbi:MAG TPA: GAF domain-containing SpoIIE family protein phosphatase [Candidatus Eisenbacteria bacterium]|jgi:sigma-B regulation protein RsbU (phosphoserine phosphatase)